MASTTGTIKRLTDRGFGFIAAPDGVEYFFHQSACVGTPFNSLRKGDRVTFEVGQGPKGPRAEHVSPAWSSGPTQVATRRLSGTAGAVDGTTRADTATGSATMHEHAQTARAMQRSIKENLTRVEQAIETCRAQVHLAVALEDDLTRLATLGEIEVSVLTLARCAAEVGVIQPFQDWHGHWHGD